MKSFLYIRIDQPVFIEDSCSQCDRVLVTLKKQALFTAFGK